MTLPTAYSLLPLSSTTPISRTTSSRPVRTTGSLTPPGRIDARPPPPPVSCGWFLVAKKSARITVFRRRHDHGVPRRLGTTP